MANNANKDGVSTSSYARNGWEFDFEPHTNLLLF